MTRAARHTGLNRALPMRRTRGGGAPGNSFGADDSGTALIVVMWIALGLITVALYFGNTMMLEYRASANGAAGLEAAHAIEGARKYVAFVLENLDEPGQMPDPEYYPFENVRVGGAMFWVLGRGDETFADGQPVFGLIDEASKLNVNTATLEMLELLPGMTSELAAAIIDWRDDDSELTPNGAESQDYLLQDPAYNCKDGAFETIEELRLLLGADFDILYGEDMNRNGIIDPNEDDGDVVRPYDNEDGNLEPGILEYLTVYSRESNTTPDGASRIDITDPNSGQALGQLIANELGSSGAQQIPQSGNYNSVLEFYMASGLSPDEFALIDDMLTTSDEPYVSGLVNVNTAPFEVLACIPGLGEGYARQIVDYRRSVAPENRNSVAWLTQVLDEDTARRAGPYLTGNAYQFTADIAAVGKNGRGFRREWIVFDTSGGDAQVIYRRGQTRLGWPLGKTIREALDAGEELESKSYAAF